MSKAPSPATQIRNLTRDLNYLRQDNARLKHDCIQYRERATKAEQAVSEWKQRFDALLKILPPTAAGERNKEQK